MSLLVFWASEWSGRWSLRLAGFVAGVAIVFALPLVFVEVDSWFTWQLVVGGGSMIALMLMILKIMHLGGMRLVRISPVERPVSHGAAEQCNQFLLEDMILWTASAALFFAVARYAKPVGMSFGIYLFVTASGIFSSLVAAAAFWTALGTTRVTLRVGVLMLAIGFHGIHNKLIFPSIPLLVPWWDWGLPLVLAAFTIASLWIFRVHGYRLCSGGG